MTYGSILVLALALSSQVSVKPVVKYDKFEDRTVITMDLGRLPNERDFSSMSVGTAHSGKKPTKFQDDSKAMFTFFRRGQSLKYTADADAKLMCGKDHIPLVGKFYNSTKPEEESQAEVIIVHLSLKTMKQFLEKNQDWDVKLSDDKPFSLGPKERAKMLSFVRFLEEGGPLPTNSTGQELKEQVLESAAPDVGDMVVCSFRAKDTATYNNMLINFPVKTLVQEGYSNPELFGGKPDLQVDVGTAGTVTWKGLYDGKPIYTVRLISNEAEITVRYVIKQGSVELACKVFEEYTKFELSLPKNKRQASLTKFRPQLAKKYGITVEQVCWAQQIVMINHDIIKAKSEP